MSKTKAITVIVSIIGAYLFGILQDMAASPDDAFISGKAVISDGDSFKINNKKIRLFGIDAPELKQICKKDGNNWNCGIAAKEKLIEIIGNREIFCLAIDDDRYQRTASNCYIWNGSEKINIGQKMVIEGMAMAYKTYSARYIINENIARLNGKGIWNSQFQKPWEWRRTRKR